MKKSCLFFLLFFCFILGFSQEDSAQKNLLHPKVGLSLSGGGAKGFAHIGVLKVMDSLGIKIDYISGTSMGAIIGGLYASGYTGKDIEKLAKETDFYALISSRKSKRRDASFFDKSVDKYLLKVPIKKGKITLPSSISSGEKNLFVLKELFKNAPETNDFRKLPIPFLCIATNLESGKMKILESGDLAEATLASSAFPSLIDPVKIGDSLYIDGAISLNFPSEPLKKRGINFVIGVNLNQGLNQREKINNIIDLFNQVTDFGIAKETKHQEEYTDLTIHPNLEELGTTSFEEKEKLIKIGYQEALKYTDYLKKLPLRKEETRISYPSLFLSKIFKIDEFLLENSKNYNSSYVLGKMNLKIPSVQSHGSINKMVEKLYATQDYESIRYQIIQQENKNLLKLSVHEDNNHFFLKFGLHYDEVFKSGLLANLTIRRFLFKNSNFSLDGVLGDKPRFYLNYFIDNGYIPGFGIYASGMSFDLKNKDGIIQENWNWYRNEAFIQSIWKDRYALGGGVRVDHFSTFNYNNSQKNKASFAYPFVFLKGDSQDSKTFPKTGFYTGIEAKLLNVLNETFSQKRAIQIHVDFRGNFPVNKWLTYRINSFYGISLNPVSDFYAFRLGGIFEQNLVNFVKFNGYELGQEKNSNIIQLSNSLQFNPYKNYFLIANINMANLFSDFKDAYFLKIKYTAIGITAGYDSPFGQIKVNYSHALNKNPGILSVILGHWF